MTLTSRTVDTKRYLCLECNKAFVRADYLKRHVGRMHPSMRNEHSGEGASAHDSCTASRSTIYAASPPQASSLLSTSHLQLQPTQPTYPLSNHVLHPFSATSLMRQHHLQFNLPPHPLSLTNNTFVFSEVQEEPLDLVIHNRAKDEVEQDEQDQPLDLSTKSRHS